MGTAAAWSTSSIWSLEHYDPATIYNNVIPGASMKKIISKILLFKQHLEDLSIIQHKNIAVKQIPSV